MLPPGDAGTPAAAPCLPGCEIRQVTAVQGVGVSLEGCLLAQSFSQIG